MIVLDDSMVHLAGIFHNMYLKLEESEDDHYLNDDGWKFHIHDVNEVPILAVTTHGTSLYPGQGRDLRLDMKKVHTLWTVNDVTVKDPLEIPRGVLAASVGVFHMKRPLQKL